MEHSNTPASVPMQDALRIDIVEAINGASRRSWVDGQLRQSAESGMRTFIVECHFDEGGPWAGPHDLLSQLFNEIQHEQPELITRHSLELIYVLPRLRHSLPVKNPTLTDLAPAEERVRSYPIDRAFRILHGLIDLLNEWKQKHDQESTWLLACENYDHAGTMTQRFFSELMRRRGESMKLKLLATVSPEQGEAASKFFALVSGGVRLQRLDLPCCPEGPISQSQAEKEAMRLEEQIGGDRIELIASFPRLIKLWKQAERGDKVLNYRYLALDLHNTLGLYDDSLRYADGLPEMAKKYAPENEHRRWAIAGKLLNIYVGLMDVPTAVEFAENVILEFAQHNQARLGVMLYTLAMLYARYQKPRNLGKGEEYLARGLTALEAARVDGTISEGEYHFQSVFNRNGLAMIRNFQRRYPEAIQICRDCVDYLNTHLAADKHLLHRSVLLYNLAQVYNAIGSHEEAIEHYEAAIALDPNYSEYYNDRGSVFLHCGRLKEAEADYLKAIELSPPYFEVFTNLGQCYRLMGNMEKAIQAYSRALDIEANQVLALLGRAKAKEESGLIDEAIADYSSAITLDASLWDAFASRGVLYYENGSLQLSLEDLNRAIELKSDQGELFENRSTVFMHLERLDQAEEDLQRALTLAETETDRTALQARLDNLSSMIAPK